MTIDLEPPNQAVSNGHSAYTALYVALSRCRSLNGLSLLRGFPDRAFFAVPEEKLKSEMERLEHLECNTASTN